MPVASVNGQELYYEVHGDGGPPLVCVMGIGSDVSGWRLQVPAWQRHFRVLIFDNRDVGRSSYCPGGYSVRDMAADAVALADFVGFSSFHLVGISLGGAVAQELALGWPERVLTLTLVVTWGGSGAFGVERVRLQVLSHAAMSDHDLLEQTLVMTLSERHFERPDHMELIRRQAREYPHPQRRDGFVRQLLLASRHEVRDRLRELSMPVQVIGAEQDMLVPAWKSRELADLIPGARLAVVGESAHAVNVEQPGELNKLVIDFVRESSPPG
jgi:pimeloyl-ACP methyl ester carboxylesterase